MKGQGWPVEWPWYHQCETPQICPSQATQTRLQSIDDLEIFSSISSCKFSRILSLASVLGLLTAASWHAAWMQGRSCRCACQLDGDLQNIQPKLKVKHSLSRSGIQRVTPVKLQVVGQSVHNEGYTASSHQESKHCLHINHKLMTPTYKFYKMWNQEKAVFQAAKTDKDGSWTFGKPKIQKIISMFHAFPSSAVQNCQSNDPTAVIKPGAGFAKCCFWTPLQMLTCKSPLRSGRRITDSVYHSELGCNSLLSYKNWCLSAICCAALNTWLGECHCTQYTLFSEIISIIQADSKTCWCYLFCGHDPCVIHGTVNTISGMLQSCCMASMACN